MAVFRVSAALYLAVYGMDSAGVVSLKKQCLTPSLFVCRCFICVLAQASNACGRRKKALCIHYSVAFFVLTADTDHRNVPNKDHPL